MILLSERDWEFQKKKIQFMTVYLFGFPMVDKKSLEKD